MLNIEQITRRLTERSHEPAAFQANTKHAAVAMILADGEHELDVCFIRRAERDGDPWSGQVAFPGGRASAVDRHAAEVAERETLEEIGLQIGDSERIGPLPIREINRQNLQVLSPFVYYARSGAQARASVREHHEVASVFWVPISHLFDARAATELEYPLGAVSTFPGIQFEDHVIWGLTLRILESFADIMELELATRN